MKVDRIVQIVSQLRKSAQQQRDENELLGAMPLLEDAAADAIDFLLLQSRRAKEDTLAAVKKHFSPLENIEKRFIFGSEAKGDAGLYSNLNIMLIGNPDLQKMYEATLYCSVDLNGRHVDPLVYTQEEWNNLLQSGNGFAKSVESGAKIDI